MTAAESSRAPSGDRGVKEGRLEALDQLYKPGPAVRARAWIAPFRVSFSDLEMEVDELVAEGDTVAARFTCSGAHTGPCRGHPPAHRRCHRVPEVSFFHFTGDRVSKGWGLEDPQRRLHQLCLDRPVGG